MLRSGRIALLAAVLAACNTTQGPPPVVSLADRACTAAPDLAGARPLALDPEQPVTLPIDAAGPCLLRADGSRSTYAVLQLPEAAAPYIVTVTSAAAGQTLFSPRLMLLDAAGAVVRERPRDAFLFKGSSLYTGIRAHPGERWLVVASDPTSVGAGDSRIVASTQHTIMPLGTAFVSMHGGRETTAAFTFAHNGTVTVVARPVPE